MNSRVCAVWLILQVLGACAPGVQVQSASPVGVMAVAQRSDSSPSTAGPCVTSASADHVADVRDSTPGPPSPLRPPIAPPPPPVLPPAPSIQDAEPREIEAKCRGTRGSLIARACSVSLSMTSCSIADTPDIGCCMSACATRITLMTAAVIEHAAQECAGRVKAAPIATNPICDLRIPKWSGMRPAELDAPCIRRCEEIIANTASYAKSNP
jgi:hypothetical protein